MRAGPGMVWKVIHLTAFAARKPIGQLILHLPPSETTQVPESTSTRGLCRALAVAGNQFVVYCRVLVADYSRRFFLMTAAASRRPDFRCFHSRYFVATCRPMLKSSSSVKSSGRTDVEYSPSVAQQIGHGQHMSEQCPEHDFQRICKTQNGEIHTSGRHSLVNCGLVSLGIGILHVDAERVAFLLVNEAR